VIEGFTVRRPRGGDFEAVTALMRECEEADFGVAERTEEDVAIGWRLLDLERDVWLVENEGGESVAYAALRSFNPVQLAAFLGVAPGHRGLGIGSLLARTVEQRARERAAEAPPDAEVKLNQWVGPRGDSARRLLEAHGYAFARRFWKMGVELGEAIPPPVWPEGMSLETLAPGGDRPVYELMNDAFRDHWGFIEHPYEEWRAWTIERESFDPSLWFLVRVRGELAGGALCRIREDGAGWVNVLGVRKEHRRLGLGLALLLHSFRELRGRGIGRAGLDVDSENTTGATRLYERAGMHVERYSDSYQKVLSPA
jgi:mycothiol synthase